MILIEGYAVVCDNDCIADAHGKMPEALKSEAEWRFFQAGLDTADVIVMGRLSHEVTPNPKNRLRLVMTSLVSEPRLDEAGTVFWNPATSSMASALELFETEIKRVAVTGGQGVFDAFLTGDMRYSVFYLSRMKGVNIPHGRKVFSRCENDQVSAEDVLNHADFQFAERIVLDERAIVSSWQPAKR